MGGRGGGDGIERGEESKGKNDIKDILSPFPRLLLYWPKIPDSARLDQTMPPVA